MRLPQKTLDQMPQEVRDFFETTMKLIGLYMPGTREIEMLVGRNTKATLTIEGGSITREVLEDTMAHLAFYKRYYPKEGEASPELDTPDKIRDALIATWNERRPSIAAQ